MTTGFNWRIKGVLIALLVILSDQLTKWLVVTQILVAQHNNHFGQWLFQKADQANFVLRRMNDFLNLVLVWNPGVSFGMLQTNKNLVFYGLIAMAILVSFGFLVWLWREPKAIRGITVGLIVGGAVGNIWDRLRFNAVIDFIDIHLSEHHWPAFNIADSAITIAVVVLLIETIFFSKNAPLRSNA
jgi:signal peptidase II